MLDGDRARQLLPDLVRPLVTVQKLRPESLALRLVRRLERLGIGRSCGRAGELDTSIDLAATEVRQPVRAVRIPSARSRGRSTLRE